MRHFLRFFGTFTALFASCAGASTAPLKTSQSAPFMLTSDELFAWKPDGQLSDRRNVSRVRLAPRFTHLALEPASSKALDPRIRVLIAPDGMNSFGNYLVPQHRFNLYTFTHWAHVDILVWFGGNSSQPVSIPARPWIDAAHRNGVKVLGTLFFAPNAWGGSANSIDRFLRVDSAGHFAAADRLVAIARYYGFDGWLINQETDLTTGGNTAASGAALARRMIKFVTYLTREAPPPMEIHWYDAMLPDGTVGWQNALTLQNLSLLEDQGQRTSDAMFLNYDWTQEGLRRSARLAEKSGRSGYDLFAGADLWPSRNKQAAFGNVRWLDELRTGSGGRALTSIALFAPNFSFNFPGKGFPDFEAKAGNAEQFEQAEVRLFAGDSLNMGAARHSKGEWPGIASLVPARSTIESLPLRTNFNTGHGRYDVRQGRVIGGQWHDMSRQDILPTWQFAFVGPPVRIRYDYDQPYAGGSSLRIDVKSGQRGEVPLFLTRLAASGTTSFDVVTKTHSPGFLLRLRLSNGKVIDLSIRARAGWLHQRWRLRGRPSERIDRISIAYGGSAANRNSVLLLGGLSIRNAKLDQRRSVTKKLRA